MLELLNAEVLRLAPGLRRRVKPLFKLWCNSNLAVLTPVRKTIAGARFWCHPRFVSMNLDGMEPCVTNWLNDRLKPGFTFFDVGANYGFHTLPGARLVGKQGRVVSFEPSPANLSVLRYHKLVNHFTQIELDHRPVSERAAERVPFYLLDGGDQASNSLTIGGDNVPFMEGHCRQAVLTDTISLDEFCLRRSIVPDVVKIDVEGAELMVLRGAKDTLRSARPTIILAIHPFWLPPGQTTSQIVELLSRFGYSIVDPKGGVCQELEYSEYLCIPN